MSITSTAKKPHRDSANDSVRPNFIVAGATKAGTTSLYEYLRQHPDIFMPEDPKRKEPQYFLNRGSGVASFQDYLNLFSGAGGCQAVGEASTAYLYATESPGWIRDTLGPIKIIIVLRDPAKRAYSLWAYMARQGFENVVSFEKALALEEARRNDPEFPLACLELAQDYFYFDTGLYHDPVNRYFDVFGRERVKIGLFEDLVKDPFTFCREIFEFLDVDPDFRPVIDIHNQGRIPRFIPLQYLAQRALLGRGETTPAVRAASLLPRNVRGRFLMKLKELNRALGSKPMMPATAYASLSEKYKPEIARLEGLLGRDLSIWRK